MCIWCMIFVTEMLNMHQRITSMGNQTDATPQTYVHNSIQQLDGNRMQNKFVNVIS
jgi:hypothetical protein